MFDNLRLRIISWFRDRSDRIQLVREFNQSARGSFVMGESPFLLNASISRGCSDYKHQFSNWLHSGFRITVESGRNLTKEEIKSLGAAILENDILVRRLVVLGWDTLEIKGDGGDFGCRWQLKDYILLR